VQDLLAALPVAVFPPIIKANQAAFVDTLGDPPPPIPHRILHCSWLI
jgi:hypothetical protein